MVHRCIAFFVITVLLFISALTVSAGSAAEVSGPYDNSSATRSSLLQDRGVLEGTVYASDGSTPLADVGVTIEGVAIGTCTDAAGHYALIVPLDTAHQVKAGGDSACKNKGYTAEWWQEAATPDRATSLTLTRAAPTVTGVNFTLAPAVQLYSTGPQLVLDGPTVCSTVSEIPNAECLNLVALYNSTNGDNWTYKTNWGVTNMPCSWFGVACQSGHVSSLSLSANQLSGSIPDLSALTQLYYLGLPSNQLSGSIPNLTALTQLQYLYLNNNQLSGNIPGLSALTQLRYLYLNNNQLGGSIPALSALTQLQYLYLNNNQLSGNIPDLSALTQLRYLYLNNNQLDGSIPALSALTQLQRLYLSNNLLSGNIPALSTLTQLQHLYLSSNQLDGSIPALTGLTQLQYIYLNNNQLSGNIPALTGLSQLQYLYLNNNQLGGSIPALTGLSQLQYLYLYSNQLSGSIPALSDPIQLRHLYLHDNQLNGNIPSLAALTQLQHLYLDDNLLSGSIPDLAALTQLRHLRLSNNQLSGSVPALTALTQLQYLSLSSNQFSGSIPNLLPLTQLYWLDLGGNQFSGNIPDLSPLTQLQYLSLSNNALEGEIPLSLTNLTALTSTDVGYNKLWATNPTVQTFLNAKDPDWIQTQTVPPVGVGTEAITSRTVAVTWTPILYTDDGGYYQVDYSQTSGGPYSFGCTAADKTATTCTVGGLSPETPYYFAVQTFTPAHDLQQNDLRSPYSQETSATTGPDIFTSCSAVPEIPQAECEVLVALYNGTNGSSWTNRTNWLMTSTLSDWYGVTIHAGHVTGLDLNNNQLNGSLPALAALVQLQHLDLGHNQLSGSIPSLSTLTQLQHLDLSNNQLGGSIPALSTLTQLSYLGLQSNQLSGGIPALSALTQLQFLYLSSNQLSGSIPVLSALTQLKELSLSNNQLSGSIPALATLTQLQQLDLGYNQLTGNIPALSALTQLSYLGLQSNQLSGGIPALSALTQLQIFYLSNNQLSGNIPALAALTQLQYLYLQNNALLGEIPPGITSLTALTNTDIGYNRLWSSDPAVQTFLNGKDPDWAQTQTIPPGGVATGASTPDSVNVTWTPILYTGDGGYYRVDYTQTSGTGYAYGCITTNKSANNCTVNGLLPNTPYFFVVRAYTPAHGDQKNNLWSPYSVEVPGTTAHLPLPAPTNLAGAAAQGGKINLTWTDNSGDETAFHIERSPDGTSGWVEIGTVGANVTSYADAGLPCGTPFYYRVRAYRGGDDLYSAYSNVANTSTLSCPPALVAPTNGFFSKDATPTFKWGAVAGATRYRLKVDNNADFSSPVIKVSKTTPTYTPTTALPNGRYYWYVQARVNGAWSEWSAPWAFTVDTVKPARPTLDNPPNGHTTAIVPVNLAWTDNVKNTDTDHFEIQVDNSPTFSNPEIHDKAVVGSPYPLNLPDGLYYWRVRAVDKAGNKGAWSAARSVRINVIPTPAPGLSKPDNGSRTNDTTPTFTWQAVADTNRYRLQVDNNADFSSMVINKAQTGTTFTPGTALADGLYYWRVQARGTDGAWGAWSAVWTFTIDTVKPARTGLTSPINGLEVAVQYPVFEWTGPVDAAYYMIQVDNSSTFGSPEINVPNIIGSTYTNKTILLPNGTYYWRVRSVDAAGNKSKWSATGKFKMAYAPAPPVLPTPVPTDLSTAEPTVEPTPEPTWEPTVTPTETPTVEPTVEPTPEPTEEPTIEPTPDIPPPSDNG